jgi:2',3'-cyclic-nucleotide 2'-phosphodiesterase (5'-nucleotidase family)
MRMKQKANKMKKDLFIIDTGDTHDGTFFNSIDFIRGFTYLFIYFIGNGLSDITEPNGKITQPLLTKIPYDLLTIGKCYI